MVDATIGHGGHSFLLGKMLGPQGTLIGFDCDSRSLEQAEKTLADLPCKVIQIQSNFAHIVARLEELDVHKVDLILADLGICSAQLADDQLGLSFQTDMPLDMRIDASLETSAADIVNEYDAESLADLIYQYGQDRASRRIARFIVRRREHERISTTGQLAEVVSSALHRPGRHGRPRIHPATRTFQALRIAVNHEMENLRALLDAGPKLLNENGYMAIISFHSLEDGMVKWDFKENKQNGIYRLLTKKPIVAEADEIAANRRARSAKLRIAQRN